MNFIDDITPCPPPCCSHACKAKSMLNCKSSMSEQTLENNRMPICDTFGPFPDETVLATIDRFLFMLNAQRMQKLLRLPNPNLGESPSGDASLSDIRESSCEEAPRVSCCKKPQASSATAIPFPSKYKMLESLVMSKGGSGRPCIAPRKPLRSIKRSFSLCSLACRKLKQACFKNCAWGCCGSDPTPEWRWARQHRFKDGCEVYEIFKQPCNCTQPTQVKVRSHPKIIFVVLPNGEVMPFETLSSH